MNAKEIVTIINKIYKELNDEIQTLNGEDNLGKKEYRSLYKAILMDILQIGEYTTQLIKVDVKYKTLIGEADLRGISSLRNFIAHGYAFVEYYIVWDSINKDIPRLITTINSI